MMCIICRRRYVNSDVHLSSLTTMKNHVTAVLFPQTHFDELWRKLQTYSGGEELFGMTVTQYPDFTSIRKELNLLQKLYNLYNAVMDSVNGYYDVLWVEVDIEKINLELLDFQTKCRKLPKALKEWQAYKDLTKKIEDFNTVCPLLERMTDKAMKERHWQRIEDLTGHKFDIESEGFTLRSVMEAPLLENMDDIEDICIAAVKERDIEAKLKQVAAEWAVQSLAFSSFKTRGELLLRGEETSETIALMEDSLMVLSSLMSNRSESKYHIMNSMYFLLHYWCFYQVQCTIQTRHPKVGEKPHQHI